MKFRKHFGLVLVILLLFSMTACGSRDSGGDSASPTEQEAEQPDIAGTAETGNTEDESAAEAKAEPSIITETKSVEEAGAGPEKTEADQAVKDNGDEQEVKASSWEGKKVSFCGDSISTFTGYIPDNYSKFYPENGDITDVNATWWMQVVNSTGMELCTNASYSGSTVSGQSQDSQDGRSGCGDKRIADLTGAEGQKPDVIIILLGANDLLNDIPLGSYDGTSAVPEGNIETFSEAYALMLDKVRQYYPEAEIYCCTAAEVSRWNDAGEKFPYKNALGLTANDYNTQITAIAQAKKVPVIDVYNCGLTYENAQENTSDGTHPNAAGAKMIADKVTEAFQ